MPEDREFNIESMYKPLVQQRQFHASKAPFRLYGGAAGGGKTYALIWEAVLRCLKYDFPVVGAIFRKSFPELDATIIRTMREMLPNWFYNYNQSQHIMTFVTGDIIEFCYAETDGDVIRYQSREWDFLGIDELTHFSQYRFTYLMSRVRSVKPLQTKFFAGTNPGGIGHAWVKSRWVSKDSEEPGYNPDDYDFIPSKVQDNIYLMEANPDYVDKLKMLPISEQKALLYGDWDVFEGQFFNEWDQNRHIVKPFEPPASWQYILGWDDGTREPRSVHLYAIDNDRRVWCVWEYYRKGESLTDAARNIRDELKKLNYWDMILKLVVDPSMRRKNDQTGLSSIEVLESMGFGFKLGEIEEGNNDRQEGWRVFKSYLSHKPYEEPMLKFFSNCVNIVKTLPQMVYYQTSKGDAKKDDLDTQLEDHAVDDCRYVLMSIEGLPGRFSAPSSQKIFRRGYAPHTTNM